MATIANYNPIQREKEGVFVPPPPIMHESEADEFVVEQAAMQTGVIDVIDIGPISTPYLSIVTRAGEAIDLIIPPGLMMWMMDHFDLIVEAAEALHNSGKCECPPDNG